jgi:hypothetical protein
MTWAALVAALFSLVQPASRAALAACARDCARLRKASIVACPDRQGATAMPIGPKLAQALVLALCAFACPAASAAEVPFVGCASDGQLGYVAPPKGEPKAVAIDAAATRQLAYYQAQDSFGVFAPRGWNCFYVYGSNGSSLMVAPGRKLSLADASLVGPAVVATLNVGGTSGRFAVAKYAARLFPREEKAFIDGVIAEGIEPKENFPSGPYPADKLTVKNPRLVEFETPAMQDGLGTSDRLQKNAQAIVGVAKLEESDDGPNLFLLSIRLPANQAALAPSIIAAAEAE